MKPHQKGAKSERNYIKKMKSYQKERNHIKKGTKPPFFMVLEPTLLNRLSWNRPFRLSCSVRLKNRTSVRLRNRLRVARFGTFSIPMYSTQQIFSANFILIITILFLNHLLITITIQIFLFS